MPSRSNVPGAVGPSKLLQLSIERNEVSSAVPTRSAHIGNCVAPGFIKTEILDSVDKKKLSAMEEKIPLGRIGNVNEIASVVYFLSSEESSYITGQVLHVNGGLTM